jgi:hypothetical protein
MSIANNDVGAYTLSNAESLRILEQQIIPEELGQLQGAGVDNVSRQPLAVFVVGQTGAGKTRAAPAIKEAMRACRPWGEPAHFIADTYKTYHPGYSRLVAERPTLASPATGPDARRWLAMAVSHAVERRADLLVESACRHPRDFADLARTARDGGYRVEVVIMAVPAALSRLGVLARFHERLPEAASGNLPRRLTPRKVHDDAYAGLLDAATFVDESTAVDQVVLVRRGNMMVFSDRRVDGEWEKGGGAAHALRVERARSLPEREKAIADHDLGKLRERDVPDLLPELDEIEALIGKLSTTESGPPLRELILPDASTAHPQDDIKPDLSLGIDTTF